MLGEILVRGQIIGATASEGRSTHLLNIDKFDVIEVGICIQTLTGSSPTVAPALVRSGNFKNTLCPTSGPGSYTYSCETLFGVTSFSAVGLHVWRGKIECPPGNVASGHTGLVVPDPDALLDGTYGLIGVNCVLGGTVTDFTGVVWFKYVPTYNQGYETQI